LINKKNALTYFNNAKKTLDEGLALYPNDNNLRSLRKNVIASAIENYSNRTR